MTISSIHETPPSVSIVIATRNRPDLLREAVRSAVEQDYAGSVEIVVVFDQSPVVTIGLEIGNTGEPPRYIRTIANERAPGLAGARNSGILAAHGSLVAFCDDDDSWMPGKLQRQVDAMASRRALACVTGIEISYGEFVRTRIPTQQVITVDDLSRSRLTGAHPSTYLIRRDVLLGKVGLVDEDLPFGYGEDYDLLLRLASHGTVAVVQAPLVRVLWHQGSFFSRRWEAMAAGIRYLAEKHPEIASDRRGRAWVEGQRAFALAAQGETRPALRTALASARANPREPRALLAALVATRLVSAEAVMRRLNTRGRGI